MILKRKDLIIPMTDSNLIEYYSKFAEKERLTDELKDFLKKRLNFLNDETSENSVLMKMAYDKIYTYTSSERVYHEKFQGFIWQRQAQDKQIFLRSYFRSGIPCYHSYRYPSAHAARFLKGRPSLLP